MNEHLHQATVEGPPTGETMLEPDSLELIAAEMDSLRARMKLLESRLEKVSGVEPTADPRPAPLASVDPQSPTSMPLPAAPGVATSNQGPHQATPQRQPFKKTLVTNSERGKRRRKSSKVNKTKKNLLFFYVFLVGGGIIAIFVFMMVNLVSPGSYLSPESSEPIEIIIEETSDLGVLRRSIQGGDE